MKLKFLFIILIISITSSAVNAQCDVSKNNLESGDVLYQTSREQIYKNEDLENGVQAVYIGIEAKQLNNLKQFKYSIIVAVGSVEPKPLIAPRVIIFGFTNGTNLQLVAATIKTNSKDGATVCGCSFELSDEDLEKITENSIKKYTGL